MNAKEIKAALADEGVQAAVAKQVAVAVKAETKRVLTIIKDCKEINKAEEVKATKVVVADLLKSLEAVIKKEAA
jgi:DNA/RNA-binding domain of Phe-tRNA-synthetase-like protein